jgi:hypothetical protein
MCPNKMMTRIKAHPDTRGKDAARIPEAVGRADWSLHTMMMSFTKSSWEFEGRGPFWLPDIKSWVFQKRKKWV